MLWPSDSVFSPKQDRPTICAVTDFSGSLPGAFGLGESLGAAVKRWKINKFAQKGIYLINTHYIHYNIYIYKVYIWG